MKKIFFIAFLIFLAMKGQGQTDISGVTLLTSDQVLPRVCVDVNLMYGGMTQNIAMTDMLQAYTGSKQFNSLPAINTYPVPDAANPSYVGKVSFKTNFGQSTGATAGAAYFFDRKKMFGFGIGISYMSLQKGTLSMDSVNVNYQSKDTFGNTFRQYLHGSGISENISTTDVSIPVTAKFKHQFKKSPIGVSAEAGGVINILSSATSASSANNLFNYEAIYKINQDGNDIYESSAVPANTDWLITQQQYLSAHNNNAAGMQQYFNGLRTEGYNVGLSQAVTTQAKVASYSRISLGLTGQAAVTYQLNYNITASLGGYYMYQELRNSGNNSYRITDTVGHYNSMLNGVKSIGVVSYGITVGLRLYIGGAPDKDFDGTPDKEDACPEKPGPGSTNGCPDHDRDGVADKDDHCPDEPGIVSAFGCPDEDYDGVPDHDEKLPGYFDRCPDVPGLVKYEGCPDSIMWLSSMGANHATAVPDSAYIKYLESKIQNASGEVMRYIVLSANTVYFKKGDTTIQSAMKPVLNAVVTTLEKNDKLMLSLSGNDGQTIQPAKAQLSAARARAVKKYLLSKGITAQRINIAGIVRINGPEEKDITADKTKNNAVEIQLLLPME